MPDTRPLTATTATERAPAALHLPDEPTCPAKEATHYRSRPDKPQYPPDPRSPRRLDTHRKETTHLAPTSRKTHQQDNRPQPDPATPAPRIEPDNLTVHIDRLVAQAPPLSDHQRAELRAILGTRKRPHTK